jgi:hypothetical protein
VSDFIENETKQPTTCYYQENQKMDSNNFRKLKKLEKAIGITRLTSLKSLCVNEVADEKFALYIA